MKTAFGCPGVSTRQHNEPAGNQDVWHYHVHVFPRWHGDRLYGSEGGPADPAECAVARTRSGRMAVVTADTVPFSGTQIRRSAVVVRSPTCTRPVDPVHWSTPLDQLSEVGVVRAEWFEAARRLGLIGSGTVEGRSR